MKRTAVAVVMSLVLAAFSSAPVTIAAEKTAADAGKERQVPKPSLNSANKFIGMEVLDAQGEKIGEIQDVLLDFDKGRIAYAVVAAGGLFGIGDANYIVPWKALSTDADKGQVMLDLTKERLAEAPTRRADMDDDEFHRQLHRFYGVSYYWDDRPGERQQRSTEKEQRGGDR